MSTTAKNKNKKYIQELNRVRERVKKNPMDFRNRKCLSCSEEFLSEGAHNRMCPKCRLKGD